MPRPHFHRRVADLQRVFASSRNDTSILQELLEELAHCRTSDARALLQKVSVRLEELEAREPEEGTDAEIQSGDSTEHSGELFASETESYGPIPDDQKRPDRLSRIRPPGTAGLPNAYVRPLKREVSLNLPVNADLPDRFIAAVAELIREIKRTGSGQKRYELEHGMRVESTGTETLYAFPFPDEAELFEDAQIEVQIAGRQIAGTVVSIEIGKLLLALKEDIGREIHSAILLIDSTALLEALRDRIEKVKKTEITLNRILADAVVGEKSWPPAPAESIPSTRKASLNGPQFRAYEHALINAVTFIWGPPGCGKTKTLGEIVRSAFEGGKRILVCSNTNKAVDQILYQICKALGREHPAMEEGRVVRFGRVVDDRLEAEYRKFVTIDGIVERRSADLKAEKQRLESSIAQIDAHTEQAQQILARFEAFDHAERRVTTEQERTNQIAQQGKLLQEELSGIKSKDTDLLAELDKRRTAFLKIFLRSEDAIRADLERNASRQRDAELRLQALKPSYDGARERFEEARRARDDLRSRVSGLNRASAQAIVSGAKDARDRFVARLREVEAKIAALRDSVLREARVLGATCTKAYLSQKDIGQVDMTIIDEASMVILPVVWFSAGLSKERVVISGDFRQIPPIVPTQQEAVFEVLGRDAFTAAGVKNPDDGRLMLLGTQYRMRPEICELIAGPMYEQRLVTFAGRQSILGQLPSKPFEQPLTIIDTSDLWPFETQNIFYSRFNMLHALLARNLAWHMRREGVIQGKNDFGICTPYAAQSRMIQKLLEGEKLDGFVPVGTVHRYQGDERRIMLLDIPESHGGFWALGQFVQGLPPEHVGARLINVAVSRAQEHLLVLANLTYLDRRLPSTSLLRGILYDMQEKGRVVPGRDVLRLRPIQSDLSGLIGQMPFDEVAESLGIFDEAQFERALLHDIQAANKSVVIFSGYVTPSRVGKIGDLLRSKLGAGVKVRCITRPPKLNGSIPESAGREAIEMLEGIGAAVDCRSKIHQKVCLIDNRIVWWGSLNALSHMYHSDETMTRAVNEGFASLVAAHMSKRPISAERALATVADAENPRCPSCGQRTVLDEGRYGPFFYCEASCGWRQSVRQETQRTRSPGHQATNAGQSTSPRNGPPCPECGGATILRQSRYGAFYGCANYPECMGKVRPMNAPNRPSRSRRAHAGTHSN